MKRKKLNRLLSIQVFGGGLSFLAFLACFTIGFSSWILTGDNAHIENNGIINTGGVQDKTDSIDLKFNKTINKSDFLSNVDTALTDDTKIDKFTADLKYTNNNYDSNFSGNLNDYFYLYNPKKPYGTESPYLYNSETNQNIYFENHFESEEGIQSKDFYSPSYLIPNTNNTSFDINEINNSLEIVRKFIDPMNGNAVEFQELSVSVDSSVTLSTNWFKIYGSKVKINDTSYQFRYHLFFKTITNRLERIDSSFSSAATDTQTTDVAFPSITMFTAQTSVNTTKQKSFSLSYTSSFSTSKRSFSFNLNNYNNNAGQSCDSEIIDFSKTLSDFTPYKSNMLSYIKNLPFNATPNISNAEVEYVSQDDVDFVTVGNFNNFYIYASRYKVLSGTTYYYRRYHFYIFYFSKKDGNIHLLYNTGVNGILDSNLTSSEWPLVEIASNNLTAPHTLGSSTSSNWRSSFYMNNRWANGQLLRLLFNYKNNSNVYNGVSYIDFRFGDYFYNHVDKNVKQSDFNFDSLTSYLLKNESNHKNPGTDIIEFQVHNDPNYPYLYFLKSRRKTTNNKYYYNSLLIFYKYDGFSSSSSSTFTYAYSLRERTSLSQATNNSDWFTIDIHSEDSSTYPSYIADVNEEHLSNIYFDYSYYNEKDTLFNLLNRNTILIDNSYTANRVDSDFNLNVSGKDYPNNNRNNYGNAYTLFYLINYDASNFYAYLKDGYWYFSGLYRRENLSSKSSFNNKFAFSPSLYGYEYYSANRTTEDTINKFITVNEMDSSYKFDYAEVLYLSNKENYVVKYHFKNNLNNYKDYYLSLLGNGGKTKYYVKNFFNACNSETMTFTYHINLRPKNDYVKQNYKQILKCFDFTFNLYMEEMEVF